MLLIQKSSPSDLSFIADCQKICFPDSFSVKRGQPYLIKSLEWFLTGENRFLYHVHMGDRFVGFCGGFVPQFTGDGSTSGIMRYAMFPALKGVLQHPSLLFYREIRPFYPLIFKNIQKKIFPNLFRKKATSFKDLIPFDKRLGLVIIGVVPDFRGKGVFELLMKTFEGEADKRKICRLVLSVRSENKRAINAYLKLGWKISDSLLNSLEMEKFIR